MSTLAMALILAAGPLLEAPWSCDATFSCTQGNGGQTSHTGLAQYAWDFGMPEGTDIKAAKGGTVILAKKDSNTGGCSQAYANDANYVVIDHGDGTAALYLHVQQNAPVSVGQQVQAGDTIAKVGTTGWTCGAHLHFQVQEICGSWWCQSVPSEFFAHGTVAYGENMTSENCGPCGASLAGGQTTISESDVTCFDRITKYWWDAGEGLDGHHWFTYATAAAQPDTIGRWRFAVDTPGDYEVEVHVPTGNAASQGAVYHIHHAGETSQAQLNQSAVSGWQSLGVHFFDGGGGEYLELPDNTGEDYGLMRPLAYDAVRFTFQDNGGTTTGDGDTGDGDTGTTGTTTGDGDTGTTTTTGDGDGGCPVGQPGCMCTAGGGCDPGSVCISGYCTPDNGGGGDGGTGTDGGLPTTGGDEAGDSLGGDGIDYGSEDTCACSSEPRGPMGTIALGLFALAGFAGIRRRSR